MSSLWTAAAGRALTRRRSLLTVGQRLGAGAAGRRLLAVLLTTAPLLAQPADLHVTVRSDSHVSWQNDFSADHQPLDGRPVGEEPSPLRLALRREASGAPYLQATNSVAGGYFGLSLSGPAGPAPTVLSFDYRAASTLRVNLIARARHGDWELGFCGPPSDTGKATWLGQIPGIVADGQWHHLELPLLRWLRQALPWPDLRLTELMFENRHSGDYLLAGFGGNPAGCTLDLAQFRLLRPGPAAGRVTFVTPAPADGFAVVLDDQPATAPPDRITQPAATYEFRGLADGTHWLHVRAHAATGWGPVTHQRLDIDTQPPTVGEFEPADRARACPAIWRCRVRDAGAGVAPASLKITVGDRVLTVQDAAVTWSPLTETLAVDLARAGVVAADGQTVRLTVSAADENGLALAQPVTATFVKTDALAKDAPTQPQLALRGADGRVQPLLGDGTFETGLDDWAPFPGVGTVLERTDRTAAAGKYSLALRCTENASPFTCFVRRTPFDAARYRIISFDYKVPGRLRADFLLRYGGEYRRVRFTDKAADDKPFGEVPGVVADDQWHHAEFNLFEMLRRAYPRNSDYTVDMLLLSAGPWSDSPRRVSGNYAGTEYFIDNFQFIPLLGSGMRLTWQARDLVGLAGAEVTTAETAAQLAAARPTAVDGASYDLDQLPQGRRTLSVRLRDKAGNLSAPVLTTVLVASARPTVGAVWPTDGSRGAPQTIGVELRDSGVGLDTAGLRLAVGGVSYQVDGNVLLYDALAGKLIWDGRRADPPVLFADGRTVSVKLAEARDLAGNAVANLPAWQFTMDWKADHTGPTVAVASRTHNAIWSDTFEDSTLTWAPEPAGAAQATVVDDGRAGHALRVTPAAEGRPYRVWHVFERQLAAVRFPFVGLRYNLPAGASADLVLRGHTAKGEGIERAVHLAGAGSGAPALPDSPTLTADGRWHWLTVPLVERLKQDGGFRVPYVIDAIGLGGQGGPAWQIDDLSLFREGNREAARFTWTAYDETGVRGYSYVLDTQPDTEPPAKANSTTTEQYFRNLTPGYGWFHIRAVDGAGNWGPTTSYLFKTPD